MFIKRIVLGTVLLICLVFPVTSARAVTLSNNSLNFSYSNPGARANAMGGAFIAVADDATAAYTNPAGLSILTKPEIALEFKSNTFTHRSYDWSYSRNSSDYKSTNNGISFLSFTYPLEKVNITVYRHQLMNSDNSFEKIYNVPGFYQRFNVDDKNHIVTYGVSGSYKVLPNLSLGLSVGFDQFDSSHSSVTTAISGGGYIDDISWSNTSQAQHFSLALLWNPFSTFNIGMVYRYGPAFEYNNTVIRVTTAAVPGPGTYTYSFRDKLKMPDFYGVGISYRFAFGLTTALDYNYILKSQTFQDNVFFTGSKTNADEYKLDDNYEIHAGVEYAFAVKETPLAIRGGYCYKPSSGVYFSSNRNLGSTIFGTVLTLHQNNMGMWDNKEQHNFSLGFGAVLGKNFQIDISGTWGTFTQEYITSLVYRF